MELKLPLLLASRQDLIHVHRELRMFLDAVTQSILKHESPIKYPGISATLRALAAENQIDLRNETACKNLLTKLDELKRKAPVVHVSFPTDPQAEIVEKLINWFRQEVDPHIIMQIGSQPTIAAGIILRTPNRQFDFSLRKHLYENRGKLKEAFEA